MCCSSAVVLRLQLFGKELKTQHYVMSDHFFRLLKEGMKNVENVLDCHLVKLKPEESDFPSSPRQRRTRWMYRVPTLAFYRHRITDQFQTTRAQPVHGPHAAFYTRVVVECVHQRTVVKIAAPGFNETEMNLCSNR